MKNGKTCPICGRAFRAKTAAQIYCGRSCAAHGRARQRQAQKPPKPKPLSIKKECEYCGKSFTPKNRNQRYCGKDCASQAANAIRRAKYQEQVAAQPKKVCPACGNEYQPKYSRQVYCSRKCAKHQFGGYAGNKQTPPAAPQMADIRITTEIPVYPELRPEVGAVYHAEVNDGGQDGRRFYVIRAGEKKVIVRKDECVEV